MRNNLFILFALCLSFCYNTFAQQENVSRTQANAIKKNSDYIYGEAAGDDENICYEMAKEKLLSKVQSFVDNHPDLSAADAFIIDNIQSKTKKLTYERSIQIKVVCVYVHKSDILPLYKSESIVVEKTMEKPIEKPILKEEEIKVISQKSTNANMVLESKEEAESYVDECFTSDLGGVSFKNNNIEKTLKYSQRENEIISAILKMKKYEEIYNFLEKEKNYRYDVRFRLVKEDNVENCFWLIFDSDRNLIAIFDKEYSVIKDVNNKNWDGYKKYPKMWVYVYQ